MSTVRIWKFPAAPPQDTRAALDVIGAAHRYYNTLVEIERARLAAFATIRRDLAPELATAEDAWLALDERAAGLVREIKSTRQQHWRRTKGDASRAVSQELEEALDKVQAAKKRTAEAAKPLRAAFSTRLKPGQEEFKRRAAEIATQLAGRAPGDERAPGPRHKEQANAAALEAMLADGTTDEAWCRVAQADAQAVAAAKRARSSCGVAPGTYLQVEEAFARAKKDSGPVGPRFRRWSGEGKIAVQLHGVTWVDVFGGTSMLALQRLPHDPAKKGKQEYMHRVRVRVGSAPDRSPVWLDTTVRINRQPPPDAAVKWAWLIARKQGERTRWEIQFVLEHADLAKPKRAPGVGGGGHVRLGWGGAPDGVRVATWPDAALVVPATMIDRAERAERLVGAADLHRDRIKRFLRLWLRVGGSGLRLPQLRSERTRLWLRRVITDYAAHTLGDVRPLWRAWVASKPVDLFVSLAEARRWMRAKGYVRPVEHAAWWLLTWARKDRHLRQWAADARVGFANARDALFRETAIRLSTQYETLSVDNYSVASMKALPTPVTRCGDLVIPVAQHRVQLVAPGRFREILREVMGPRCTPCERPGDAETSGGARTARNRKGKRPASATNAASTTNPE